MQSAVLVFAVCVLAIIAYGDVRRRRIPNALTLAIAALGLVRIILAQDIVTTSYTITVTIVAFAVTFALFLRGVIGGGDAKLITAMALLIGYQGFLNFLLLMSLFGGVLALATLAQEKLSQRADRLGRLADIPSLAEAARSVTVAEKSTVPYGVAVAAAGVIMLIISR